MRFRVRAVDDSLTLRLVMTASAVTAGGTGFLVGSLLGMRGFTEIPYILAFGPPVLCAPCILIGRGRGPLLVCSVTALLAEILLLPFGGYVWMPGSALCFGAALPPQRRGAP